jgi:hypothetical protein
MDTAQYLEMMAGLNTPTKFNSNDWQQQPFLDLPLDYDLSSPSMAAMHLSIPIPSSSMSTGSQLSPAGRSTTSSVPSLASPSSRSSTPNNLFTPPGQGPLHANRLDHSIFGAMQESFLGQKPTGITQSSSYLNQPRRMSTPILTEIPSKRSLRRPSNLYISTTNPFLASSHPVRRSSSEAPMLAPSAPVMQSTSRSKTVMGGVQPDYFPDMAYLNYELPMPQGVPSHYNVSGVNLGTEDLGMLDQLYQPAYYTYDNLPASAPAWRTNFDVPPIIPAMPFLPETTLDFSLMEHSMSPIGGQFDMSYRPISAPLQRNYSANAAVPKPTRPMPTRRVTSAPATLQKRRATAGPAQFVNFTSADASRLLNGVAPSGSSKRKREEETGMQEHNKRCVSSA